MQAIAEALREAGIDDADMRFVGSRRGQEATLLGDGPIALKLLPGRGLRRSLAPRAVLDNIGALLGLARAVLQSLVIVRQWKPRVVVSVGGYAAAAMSTAAVMWRRPLVLVDLDVMPSVTHRLLSRFATVRCVALGTASAHVVVTGAPVRHDLAELDRSPDERQRAKARLSPPIDHERRVVVVMDDIDTLPAATDYPQLDELSSRQREIVIRLLNAQRVSVIAAELYVSPSTVRNHLVTIFTKFGVHSQVELLAVLRRHQH